MIAHPHDAHEPVPIRLPPDELRALSRLSPGRAVTAMAVEWLVLAAAMTAAVAADAWPITVLAVLVIGARQHALTVIAHDAAHYRLFSRRRLNDWVANVVLAWPMFISVQGFRHFHAAHHRHLGTAGDGNRRLWHTHDAAGHLTEEWRYPKSPARLILKLLRRAAFVTGLFWMLRGLVGGFMYGATPTAHVARVALYVSVGAVLTRFGAWREFLVLWVVPYCTWHAGAQYVRLVCEHSAERSPDPRYAATRSTIPGALARFFVLPRNIGYHLEHHWFPGVPFYRLPALHARLTRDPEFAGCAQRTASIRASLAECVRAGG